MVLEDLSDTEKAVYEAFATGRFLDVTGFQDKVVRSEVVRYLLLGGVTADVGQLPALRLSGANITGQLMMAYADVVVPLSLRDCVFEAMMDIYGARLRQFSMRGCVLPGLIAANATFEANLRLTHCRINGTLHLAGSHISNAFILDGTELSVTGEPDSSDREALDGTRLRVGADILARRGFRSDGEVRLTNAEVGGSLRWEGACLSNPGGRALYAPDLRVGAIANLCNGFRADGSISLNYAQITSRLCFEGATLEGDEDTTLGLRHLQTRELLLLPAEAPAGTVDLRHARVGLLRDDPETWPRQLRLEGLTYEALSDAGDFRHRLGWLLHDPHGYRPQTYGQLATAYRGAGRDDEAREIMLASERHRRRTLTAVGRMWSHAQDVTVGYGYRPSRAVAWLAAFLLIGTVLFTLHPPRAAEAAKAPEFVALAYTADLILPVIDLGQQSAYHARGVTVWFAYFLILAGLLFTTTIAAATARRLRRT